MENGEWRVLTAEEYIERLIAADWTDDEILRTHREPRCAEIQSSSSDQEIRR